MLPLVCPISAISGCEQSQQGNPLLDHLVGAASSVAGTSMPCAFAVFRLITSSYLVGACTGRSPGFDRYSITSQLGSAASGGKSLDLFNACLANDFPPTRNVAS